MLPVVGPVPPVRCLLSPLMKTLVVLFFSLLLFPATVRSEELAPSTEFAGAALYHLHCADCHRQLENTDKPRRSAERIRSAIEHFPVMNHLASLTDEQCRAIAQALRPEQTPTMD